MTASPEGSTTLLSMGCGGLCEANSVDTTFSFSANIDALDLVAVTSSDVKVEIDVDVVLFLFVAFVAIAGTASPGKNCQ